VKSAESSNCTNLTQSFLPLVLCCQVLELVSHEFTELLETFHELFVVAVFGHGFFWIGLEEVDGFEVLGVGEEFVDFLVGFDCVEEVVVHPLLSSFIKVIVHFHGFLDFLDFERVFVGGFEFGDFILFGFRV
jgi:hypothetical protein